MPKQEHAEPPVGGNRQLVIRFKPSTSAIITLLLVIGGLWVMHRLVPVVLVLVAALIIVGTISPAVLWLERRRIHRNLGITIVFMVILTVTVLFITMTIPSLMAQARTLLDQGPAARVRLANWLSGSYLTRPLAELLRDVHADELIRMAASNAMAFSTSVIAIFAYILSSVFLALYIMIDRDRLRGGFYLVVPRSHHIRLSRVMLNLETIVCAYIRRQAITCLFMGVFVFLLLSVCRVPNALAIAVFAGVADVLPYIGALLSVGAAAASALSRGPVIIITVLVLMFIYEEFESRVIVPRIYGRTLRLPSAVILFSLLSGSVLLGITGALLALPVAAAVRMLFEELRVELPGQQEQAEDVEIRERDDRGEEEYERRAEGMPAEQAAAIAVEISADRHKAENGVSMKTDDSMDGGGHG